MLQSLPIRDNWRVGSDIERGDRGMVEQDARGDAPREDAWDRRQIIREFSEVLDRNSRLLIQVSTRELAERYGLSLLQAHALETLWRGEPELEMSALAAATTLPASTATSIVDRLVKLGLVERWHSDVDRRRVLVKITPAGEDVMTRIDAWGIELFEHLLGESDTEDLMTCIKVFSATEERVRETFDLPRPTT
jgi:DNA-binding MarR family transcriptional regulator